MRQRVELGGGGIVKTKTTKVGKKGNQKHSNDKYAVCFFRHLIVFEPVYQVHREGAILTHKQKGQPFGDTDAILTLLVL